MFLSRNAPARQHFRKTAVYGLIGYPVARSLSPLIHNYGFRLRGLHASYLLIPINPSAFREGIRRLRDWPGLQGFNVTIPYKTRLQKYIERLDDTAAATGAVNTIKISHGQWIGYNTDVYGFIRWLRPYRERLRGKRILLAGAGGAAAAALYALTHHFSPRSIAVTNRHTARAERLIQSYGRRTDLRYLRFQELLNQEFDVLINALALTPVYPEKIARVIRPHHYILDMNYHSDSPLSRIAKSASAFYRNGTDMLIYQAQASFRIWTGHHLPVKPIRELLRDYRTL